MIFWVLLPLFLMVPLGLVAAFFFKRATESGRREFSFFSLGFFVCAILFTAVPRLLDYLGVFS